MQQATEEREALMAANTLSTNAKNQENQRVASSIIGPLLEGLFRAKGIVDTSEFRRMTGWSETLLDKVRTCEGTVTVENCALAAQFFKLPVGVLLGTRHINGEPTRGKRQRFLPKFFTEGDRDTGERIITALNGLGVNGGSVELAAWLARALPSVRKKSALAPLQVLQGKRWLAIGEFQRLMVELNGVAGKKKLAPPTAQKILGPAWLAIRDWVKGSEIVAQSEDNESPTAEEESVEEPTEQSAPEGETPPGVQVQAENLSERYEALNTPEKRAAFAKNVGHCYYPMSHTLTRGELAEKLGKSASFYSQLVNRRLAITPKLLDDLSNLFDKTPQWFVEEHDFTTENTQPSPTPKPFVSRGFKDGRKVAEEERTRRKTVAANARYCFGLPGNTVKKGALASEIGKKGYFTTNLLAGKVPITEELLAALVKLFGQPREWFLADHVLESGMPVHTQTDLPAPENPVPASLPAAEPVAETFTPAAAISLPAAPPVAKQDALPLSFPGLVHKFFLVHPDLATPYYTLLAAGVKEGLNENETLALMTLLHQLRKEFPGGAGS